VIISRTEDRMRALLERGWRPTLKTHPAGTLSALERDAHAGPWTITGHNGEQPTCSGWVMTVHPSARLSKQGHTSSIGGVYATLDQCLDEAERFVTRDTERVAAIVTRA